MLLAGICNDLVVFLNEVGVELLKFELNLKGGMFGWLFEKRSASVSLFCVLHWLGKRIVQQNQDTEAELFSNSEPNIWPGRKIILLLKFDPNFNNSTYACLEQAKPGVANDYTLMESHMVR